MKKFLPYLLTSLLFVLGLGQLTRIGFPDRPIYIYFYDVLVAAGCFWLIGNRDKVNPPHDLTKAVVLFLSWTAGTFLLTLPYYNFSEHTIALLYLLRLTIYLAFIVYLIGYRQVEKLVQRRAVVIFISLVFIGAWVQYLLYPNLGNLAYLGWDPHLYRMVGLFFDPPTAAAVFALIALYAYYAKDLSPKLRWSILIAFAVMFILTVSRGALISAIVTLALVFARRVNWKYIIVGMISLFIIWNLVPGRSLESLNIFRTTSIKTRLMDYQKGIQIWQKSPLIGIGYNHITPEKNKFEETTEWLEPYNPSHASASFHSSFMIILVTTGVIGLGLFVYLLVQLGKVHEYAQTSLIFLSLFSLFDNVLLLPMVLLSFAVLMRKIVEEKS